MIRGSRVLHSVSSSSSFASIKRQCSLIIQSFSSHSDNSILQTRIKSFIHVAQSCSSSSSCRSVHAQVIKSSLFRHGFLGDILVSAYGRLDSLNDAHNLFDEITHKDLVSWNSFISVFSRLGLVEKCLNVLNRMRVESDIEPNEVTLISTISAIADVGEGLDEGNSLHGIAVKVGLLFECKLLNALINMYGKFGHLDSAYKVFVEMHVPTQVSWNSLIAVHVHNGFPEKGIVIFKTMRMFGFQPDEANVVSFIQACEDLGIEKLAESIHSYVFASGLVSDLTIMTSLLRFYAKSGRLLSSYDVFKEIKKPDRIAWTAMLAGYAIHGYGKQAIEFFEFMINTGCVRPDHVTFTHLLSACSHSGLVNEGRAGRLIDARKLIDEMPMEPTSGVWASLLNACRVHGNMELGEDVGARLLSIDPLDSRNYLMLSNIYSNFGRWKDAAKVRSLMKGKRLRKVPGWSSIECENEIHRFVAGDRSHRDSEEIYAKLDELIGKVRKIGYVSKTELVLHDVEEDVKRDMIEKHSEKLAVAFGLLVGRAGRPMIITKNIRICGDCHVFAKLVSVVEKLTIIIRDPKRFHHFSDGLCSCGDFW
ncbi:pentatricopeptide repeat-containing protein At5g40410, mitochondrial isoform X2 [Impatiens glandulifera]|uniref:pentatricopeptide repeat-containing protein At5g40410, mitochondrial isoform X2 n=1 Tax=Impatiens glandulifera TaxID=253017 RepID=UPI001FB18E69|nr:pentatricopeptide repeat-containing protein At5g40410, mitochondrial isoform X2 [Impatiens glandulifera]